MLQNAAIIDPATYAREECQHADLKIARAAVVGSPTTPYIFCEGMMGDCMMYLDMANHDYRMLDYSPPLICAAVLRQVTPDESLDVTFPLFCSVLDLF